MAYVLVLFRAGARIADADRHARAHEDFVASLIRRNLVLLGGAFSEPLTDLHAGYLLRCASVEEARALVREDAFFAQDVFEPLAVEWRLLGINTDAVDTSAILTPRDV